MDPRRYRSGGQPPELPAPKTFIDGFIPPSRSLPKTPMAVPQSKPVFTAPVAKSIPTIEPVRRGLPVQRPIRLEPQAPTPPPLPKPVMQPTSNPAPGPAYAPRRVAYSIQPQYQPPEPQSRPSGLQPAVTRLKRPRDLPRWLVAIPAGILIVWLGTSLFRHPAVPLEASRSLTQKSALQTQAKVPVVPTYPTVQQQTTFEAAVQKIMADNPGVRTTVVARNLKTGKEVTIGSNDPYIAASTGKLLTAATVFKEVEAGRLSLNRKMSNGLTAQATLQKMIVNSDNDCWAVLNTYVGRPKLTARAVEIGMVKYKNSNNSLLTSDTALLVRKLYDGSLMNASNRNLLLGWMKTANYRGYIVAAVPAEYTIYHKVGIYANVLHDAAIITKGDEALELVVYTEGTAPADPARTVLIKAVTTEALAAFFKPAS